MKTIGLIGGMSWESSLEYYRIINEEVKKQLGGFHSAECLMYSFDFQTIEKLQHEGDWEKLTELMVLAARKIEKGGADFIVICTNTMHKMADRIQEEVNIPLLHMVDVIAKRIKSLNKQTVGLLGTRFTMEQGFYKDRLRDKYGLQVLIPDEQDVRHDGPGRRTPLEYAPHESRVSPGHRPPGRQQEHQREERRRQRESATLI